MPFRILLRSCSVTSLDKAIDLMIRINIEEANRSLEIQHQRFCWLVTSWETHLRKTFARLRLFCQKCPNNGWRARWDLNPGPPAPQAGVIIRTRRQALLRRIQHANNKYFATTDLRGTKKSNGKIGNLNSKGNKTPLYPYEFRCRMFILYSGGRR